MSAEIGAGDAATGRFDTLHAEAKEALSYAANTLRAVTERYREAFHQDLGVWHGDSDALDLADRVTPADPTPATPGGRRATAAGAESTDAPNRVDAAEAAAGRGQVRRRGCGQVRRRGRGRGGPLLGAATEDRPSDVGAG